MSGLIHITMDIQGSALKRRDPNVVHQVLEAATFQGTQFIKGLWIAMAHRLKVRRTGAYIRGIQDGEVRKLGSKAVGDLHEVSYEIINSAPHASIVEHGHAAFSMANKVRWGDTSGSIKQGKNGPYLSIPFRHRAHASESSMAASGTTMATRKAMMPRHIYNEAKKLDATRRMGAGAQRTPSGQFVAADKYKWGGRLQRGKQAGIAMGGPGASAATKGWVESRQAHTIAGRIKGKSVTNPAWQGSKYQGLFRTEQKKAGGGHDSTYMTIRTLTPDSQGWNIPALIGKRVAFKVAYGVTHGAGAVRLKRQLAKALVHAMGEQGE